MFYQNIPTRGKEFFPTLSFIEGEFDGSMSCNECEIALTKQAVNKKFKKMVASVTFPSKFELCDVQVIRDKSKYID